MITLRRYRCLAADKIQRLARRGTGTDGPLSAKTNLLAVGADILSVDIIGLIGRSRRLTEPRKIPDLPRQAWYRI